MPGTAQQAVVAALCCAALLSACGSGSGGDARRSSGPEVQLPRAGADARRRAPKPKVRPPAVPSKARPPSKPPIVWRPIPFGAKRRSEMAAYSRRHYGLSSYRLKDPRVIVVHYTGTRSVAETYGLFAPDRPDPELHELPGICSHFVVDRDGTIYQLVPLGYMCRHTVGLNYTSFGVEQVGTTDAQILGNPRELRASLRLTRWLRCRFGIPVADVIGHNESLSSGYHRENVASLRGQTHPDFRRADMAVYRRKLAKLGGC